MIVITVKTLQNFRGNEESKWSLSWLKGVTPDFDLSLSYQISWTDYASFNRIFSMKHLTQKVFNDSLSAVTKSLSGGSKELPKFETSKRINFCYSYPIFIIFSPFDFIFNCFSKLVVSFTYSQPFSQKSPFGHNNVLLNSKILNFLVVNDISNLQKSLNSSICF